MSTMPSINRGKLVAERTGKLSTGMKAGFNHFVKKNPVTSATQGLIRERKMVRGINKNLNKYLPNFPPEIDFNRNLTYLSSFSLK